MEGMKEVEKINTEDLIHEVEKHFSSCVSPCDVVLDEAEELLK